MRPTAEEARSILQIFSWSRRRPGNANSVVGTVNYPGQPRKVAVASGGVPSKASSAMTTHHHNDRAYNLLLQFVDDRFDMAAYVAFKVFYNTCFSCA